MQTLIHTLLLSLSSLSFFLVLCLTHLLHTHTVTEKQYYFSLTHKLSYAQDKHILPVACLSKNTFLQSAFDNTMELSMRPKKYHLLSHIHKLGSIVLAFFFVLSQCSSHSVIDWLFYSLLSYFFYIFWSVSYSSTFQLANCRVDRHLRAKCKSQNWSTPFRATYQSTLPAGDIELHYQCPMGLIQSYL